MTSWKTAVTLGHAVLAAALVGLAGVASYYGYAIFGESAQRSPSVSQWHSYTRYHK